MVFGKWQRTRIANRIAARSAHSAIIPDRASTLASQLPLKLLRRVDSITKNHGDYYPELPEKILDVTPAYRDVYLDHLELLISKVREMEKLYNPIGNASDIPFYTEEIIGHVLAYLTDYPLSRNLTDEQKGALIAVYFLLTKYWHPDAYPDEFPAHNPAGSPRTSDRWLTRYTLDNPGDPDAVYHAYVERCIRRKTLAQQFTTSRLKITPETMPDVICDYPVEVTRTMHSIAVVSHERLSVLMRLANEEITGTQMKEVMHYTALIDGIPFHRVARATSNLRKYPAFKDSKDLTLAPQHVKTQYKAVIKVSSMTAMCAHEFISPDGTLTDQRLVDLLLEHPERADDLATVINERESADFDLITGITSNVLGEGLL